MLVINYKNKNEPHSTVKIILKKEKPDIEFDVFFMRFPMEGNGKDVTINWRDLNIKTEGIFYTDANAHKVVKRTSTKEYDYPITDPANSRY